MEIVKRTGIRIALFLLIHAIVILLCIVLSNLLHVAAAGLFENEESVAWVETVLSLFAFLGILYYSGRTVSAQAERLKNGYFWSVVLLEIIPMAVYLLAELAVSLLSSPPQLFVGAPGYLFCPYLSFGLWKISPFLGFSVYLLVFSGFVLIRAFLVRSKKSVPTEVEKETDPTTEN